MPQITLMDILLSHREQEELFLMAPPPEDPDYQAVLEQLDYADIPYWDTVQELAANGMFRDREENGIPISGSDADLFPGDDGGEYRYYTKLLGCQPMEVVNISAKN